MRRLATRRFAARRHAAPVPSLLPTAADTGSDVIAGGAAAGGWPRRVPRRTLATFVSSHFRVDEGEVRQFLARKHLWSKENAEHFLVKECPFCGKPTYNKADNQWKLYIKKADGAYFCHRCGAGGSWFDFKQKMGDGSVSIGSMGDQAGAAGAAASPPPRVQLAAVVDSCKALVEGHSHPDVLEYLTRSRGISVATLREYLVGARMRTVWVDPEGAAAAAGGSKVAQQLECVVFPLTEVSGLPLPPSKEAAGEARPFLAGHTPGLPAALPAAAATKRAAGATAAAAAAAAAAASSGASYAPSDAEEVPEHAAAWLADSLAQGGVPPSQIAVRRQKVRPLQRKDRMIFAPKGVRGGLFGAHTVPVDATSVVLTEGEFDAMAVRQATGLPAVSLPNGCRSLPVEVLPWLDRFQRIYIFMDDDEPGRDGAERIAQKLGGGRCHIVRTEEGRPAGASDGPRPKDANDALLAGWDLPRMVQRAQPQPHEQIMTFQDLRSVVLDEVTNPQRYAGTPFRSLPSLQRLLKGHRAGELTILTGPTGAGKTTLLSQLSIDLAAQGMPTLWGSFEIKNAKLLKRMMQQYAGVDLAEVSREQLEALADDFAEEPLYFMKFFGSTDVDAVIDAMDYAVYAHDVVHVVLDNLQFMLSSASTRGFDRFDAQEAALDKFRKFATSRNVHLSIVIHPRKEADGQKLSLNSVFGTAKATQEADNVMILQLNPDGSKNVDVRKNRHDGATGSVPLRFDGECQLYREMEDGGAPIRGGVADLPQGYWQPPAHSPIQTGHAAPSTTQLRRPTQARPADPVHHYVQDDEELGEIVDAAGYPPELPAYRPPEAPSTPLTEEQVAAAASRAAAVAMMGTAHGAAVAMQQQPQPQQQPQAGAGKPVARVKINRRFTTKKRGPQKSQWPEDAILTK